MKLKLEDVKWILKATLGSALDSDDEADYITTGALKFQEALETIVAEEATHITLNIKAIREIDLGM